MVPPTLYGGEIRQAVSMIRQLYGIASRTCRVEHSIGPAPVEDDGRGRVEFLVVVILFLRRDGVFFPRGFWPYDAFGTC